MRITDIHLINASDGLEELKFTSLGQVVVLAGPNGAGKSRILNRVEAATRGYVSVSQAVRLRKELEGLSPGKPGNAGRIGQINSELAMHALVRTDHDNLINAIRFVPRAVEFTDPATANHSQLAEAAGILDFRFLLNSSESTLVAIQGLQNMHVNLTHPQFGSSANAIGVETQYKRLSELIEQFLNTTLGRDADGLATIFSRPLRQAGLSDGQKILLQLAAALVRDVGTLHNDIVLMDEPESHLHPAAIRDFLSAIRRVGDECQVWIATHSVHILSMFDPVDLSRPLIYRTPNA